MQIQLLIKKLYDGKGVEGIVSNALVTKYNRQWYIDHNTLQKETRILINLWLLMVELRFYKKFR